MLLKKSVDRENLITPQYGFITWRRTYIEDKRNRGHILIKKHITLVSLLLWHKMVAVCCFIWLPALWLWSGQAGWQTKIRVLVILKKLLYPTAYKCFLVFTVFAIDFVPFAVEFIAFAVEFVLYAIEFIGFALEFIAFAQEFVIIVLTAINQLLITRWIIIAMENTTWDATG